MGLSDCEVWNNSSVQPPDLHSQHCYIWPGWHRHSGQSCRGDPEVLWTSGCPHQQCWNQLPWQYTGYPRFSSARCYGNKLLWAYCSHSRWVRSAAWTFWSKRQKWELDCHGHFLDFSGDEHCFTPAAVPPPTNFSFPPSQLSCPQWFAGAVVTLWSSAVSKAR